MRSGTARRLAALIVVIGMLMLGAPVLTVASASAASAAAMPGPGCTLPLEDDDSVPQAVTLRTNRLSYRGVERCVASYELRTRSRLNPLCVRGLLALNPAAVYSRNMCNAPIYTNQIEAIAQARAVAKFNLDNGGPTTGERPGVRSSMLGVTGDVQWEVELPGYRADILLYDSQRGQDAIVEVIEVKLEGNDTPAIAAVQARNTADAFPGEKGTVHDFRNSGNYSDSFYVVRPELDEECDSGLSAVEGYSANGLTGTDETGVIWVSSTGTGCVPSEWSPPADEDEEEEEPADQPEPADKNFLNCLADSWGVAKDAHEWFSNGFTNEAADVGGASAAGAASIIAKPPTTATGVSKALTQTADLAADVTKVGGSETLGVLLAGTIVGVGTACAINPNVWGDPHLVTLDGRGYNFQTAGEFHLLQIPSAGLDVQARFSPIVSSVSLLSAVALNVGDDRLELRANGTVLINGDSEELNTDGLYTFGDAGIVIRSGEDRLVVLEDPGMIIQFSGRTVGVYVSDEAVTKGLLGNNDGESRNDLSLANGSALSDTASAGVIHGSYADSWRITDQESLFTYGTGQSTETYTDLTFPADIVTIDEFPASDIEAAQQICFIAGVQPGAQFDGCVYDVLVTEDETYAEDALAVTDEIFDPQASGFDAFNELAEDFTSPVPSNFAHSRYLSDPGTTRVAGPIFDSTGYSFDVLSVPRHDTVNMTMNLIAYGEVDIDTPVQSVDIIVDGGQPISATLEGNTPDLTGAPPLSSLELVRRDVTTSSVPYSVYKLEVPLPHFGPSISVRLDPHEFRGILDTSLGVDQVDLALGTTPEDEFNVSTLPMTVSSGAPSSGAGVLETGGSLDSYNVSIPAGDQQDLAIQPSCSSRVKFSLVDSSGELRRPTSNSCGLWRFDDLEPGNYRIDVTEHWWNGDGNYGFDAYLVPAPQEFDYDLGDTVEPGSPDVGAGTIETPVSIDRYEFTVPTGGRYLQFQRLTGSRTFVVRDAASGDEVTQSNDATRRISLHAGVYEIEFAGPPGEYSFKLFEVPDPQEFAYTLGDVVEDGDPQPGAGNLETTASVDRYSFTVPPGVSALEYVRNSGGAFVRITSADGLPVAGGYTNDATHRFTLNPGDYIAEFAGNGPYSFYMFAVPPPQAFAYSIGSTVSNGVPASGAGNLETSASVDGYTFSVPAGGTRLVFERLSGTGTYYELYNATSGVKVDQSNDVLRYIDLPEGDYRLDMHGPETVYSFKLSTVAGAQVFVYTLDTTVSDGVPAAGAGRIEATGAKDRYQFTVPAGATKMQYVRASGSAGVTITTAAGASISGGTSNDSSKQFTLSPGDYIAEFAGNVGIYSFKMFIVPPPQTFTYALGTTVSNGVPEAGAGNLETVASLDRYTFTVPAGASKVQYVRNSGGVSVTFTTGSGGSVPNGTSNDSSKQFTLSPGDYVATFSGSGTYSFQMFEVPPPQVFAYTLGTTVSNGVPEAGAGNLETIASLDRYTFTIPSGAGGMQYTRYSGGVSVNITTSSGGAVASGSSNGSSKLFTLAPGDYVAQFSGSGTYSFKFSPV